MKHRADAVQRDPDARSLTLADFCPHAVNKASISLHGTPDLEIAESVARRLLLRSM